MMTRFALITTMLLSGIASAQDGSFYTGPAVFSTRPSAAAKRCSPRSVTSSGRTNAFPSREGWRLLSAPRSMRPGPQYSSWPSRH